MKCPKCQFDNPSDSNYCKECGTKLLAVGEISVTKTLETPREELTTGATFAGRYQIIEELGKGGMGRVYKVHDARIKEKIALKLIKPEISQDKKTIERFNNELKLARKIRQKNICQMFDLGEEKGTHFITMEFVPGQDLKGLIRQSGQLAVGTTINIAKQICAGLAEAHRLGVVHRDLKPSNIMIDKEGNVRIMDFGIARSLEAKGITGAGVMIGTPEYMSPEQVEGKETDQRSDIYSLGAILYEMVTGRVPFEGDTPFTIGMKHKGEMPQNPKELNTQISDELSQLILRCMEKEKENRYQSAEEVRYELTNIEKGIPTTEKVAPKSEPLTSKKITVTFGLRKLFFPALIVIACIVIGLFLWRPWLRQKQAPIPSDKPSVAVLPFEDLSPHKDQEFFCDGLADELINRLTRIENLKVPARTSAFSFKGKESDIQEIGKQLNVEMVLEGSLRKAGTKLRITVQLVDVSDGYPIWSERYERDEQDIFVLQDEISLAIVDNLKLKLLSEERVELIKRHTDNLEAYNLYLKGRYHWNKRTKEGIIKSIEYLKQVIEIDPTYSLAYSGLADSYIVFGEWSFFPPKEVFPKAKTVALRALEINKELAEAHTALAAIKRDYEWDWSGAEIEYRRAIELNPNYATAHQWYAEYLTIMGRFDEAIKEIKRAQELDPLSLIITSIAGGIVYYNARMYDKGVEQCLKVLDLDSEYAPAHLYLGWNYKQKEMYEESIAELEKARELSKARPFSEGDLAHAYALADQESKSQLILQDLKKRADKEFVNPFTIAIIYIGLGDRTKAFEWLDKAYDNRSYKLLFLKVDPIFDRLRSDPRFKALLKKMNLE